MRCVLTLLPLLILGCIDDVALPQQSGCSDPECPTSESASANDDPAQGPSTGHGDHMGSHGRAFPPEDISTSTHFTMSAQQTDLRQSSKNGAYQFTPSDPVGVRVSRNGRFIMEASIRP